MCAGEGRGLAEENKKTGFCKKCMFLSFDIEIFLKK